MSDDLKVHEQSDAVEPRTLTVKTGNKNGFLDISVEGYGNCCEVEEGSIVALEIWEGELRLLVWSDINREDPTHVISLEDAQLDKREEE
jgi:hypothetical protein